MATNDGIAMTFHAVSRGGVPFLFLPTDRRAAAKALEIYPAQTAKARLAKAALGILLRLGLRPRLQKQTVTISNTDPFAAFLRGAARVEPGEPFSFAVLAGNPNAPGRRHVFLVFNSDSQPVAVVKAGASRRARELITHETAILSGFSGKPAGLPRLRSACDLENLSAFAMDFIEGTCPDEDSTVTLEEIFSSWVGNEAEVALADIPAIQRLLEKNTDTTTASILNQAATNRVLPVLMHGDFAPWNVKVDGGAWTVLDWERGERVGVPAWDWFHFVIQPSVLVKREPTEATVSRLAELFESADFIRYSKQCKIQGLQWLLLLAYVEYCIHVIRQTEGLDLLKALRAEICDRVRKTPNGNPS